jgi:hypothetical protein
MLQRIPGAAALAVALVLAGCSKSPPAIVPVEGIVTINGNPLPSATVTFVPMIQGYGAEYIATGTTDEKGRFKVECKAGPGACACENRVTLTDAPAPDKARGMSAEAQTELARYSGNLKNRPIPPDYGNVGKTPLVLTPSAGQSEYKLELKR